MTVRVSFSLWEMALVMAGAGREGMAAAAWLGEVGVRAASTPSSPVPAAPGRQMQQLMVMHSELMDLRRILRTAGGNLNDVARHANSTGTLAAETEAVQALVARVVGRIDTAAAELTVLLAQAREAQLTHLAVTRWRR